MRNRDESLFIFCVTKINLNTSLEEKRRSHLRVGRLYHPGTDDILIEKRIAP